MSEIQIDHEAANKWALVIDHSEGIDANLARAYLDLQQQLAAERARGNAYAEEVRRLNNIMEGRDNAHAQGETA